MNRKGALLFALGMLVCLFILVMTWGQMASLRADQADILNQQNILEGKMRRQQSEYNALVVELPVLRQEAEDAVPQAEAAMEAEDAAKTNRRTLRREVQALQEEAARAAFTASAGFYAGAPGLYPCLSGLCNPGDLQSHRQCG